jgi:peptidoglycan/LPS O-acetylase OafA/YrhL
MPELDSLRGVAILLVLFYHGYFWMYNVTGLHGVAKAFVEATRPGWLGVNLFFVLSGFLITGILLQSKSKDDYYRRFYARRALRILPAYYALLLLLFLTGLKPYSFLLLSFFYLANVTPLFGVPEVYPVLWSLAVEEQFYLLWPTVVHQLPVRVLERCVIGIVCVVPVLRAVAFLLGWQEGLSSYTWFVADGLAMGAWLAMYVRRPELNRETLARISAGAVGFATLATFAGSRYGILTRERLLGATFQESCGDLAFAGVLGLVLLLGTSQWKQFVQWPVLKFYGDISYGLYLIHLFVITQCNRLLGNLWPQLPAGIGHFGIMTLRFAIYTSCATGLAFLSRRYFEEPFLRMKDRFAPTRMKAVPHGAADQNEQA